MTLVNPRLYCRIAQWVCCVAWLLRMSMQLFFVAMSSVAELRAARCAVSLSRFGAGSQQL